MPWLNMDDRTDEDPAIEQLSDKAFRVFHESCYYSARNLTDGVVTEASAKRRGWTARTAAELVAAGLWLPADGGWVIRSYLKYNRSKAQIEVERENARERQAKRRRKPDGSFK